MRPLIIATTLMALLTGCAQPPPRVQIERVNVAIPVPVAYHSFGGWGESLFGDTHIYGPEGVAFYTRNKVVTTRWADPSTRGTDLGFPTNS